MDGSSALRPGLSLVFSVLTAIIGFVIIGQLAGILIGGLFYEGTMIQWIGEFTNSLQISEKIRLPLLVMQGCGTAFGLVLTPWLYLRIIALHPGFKDSQSEARGDRGNQRAEV
ncbi:MAG: hypothetical protein ACO3FI_03950, partial [Cyclobacteriaceae bacterium]